MANDTQVSDLVRLTELVHLYMLPELKEDLDAVQLQVAHFASFQNMLRQELPILYDLLQRNENILLNGSENNELKAQLVLLMCELTAVRTIYKLEHESQNLLNNANEVLNKLSRVISYEMEAYIFKYYEEKLHKDCWKRQLGAIHGYERYLEHRFDATDVKEKMSSQLLTFSLAVGLNARECYESVYKQLGIHIFSVMLKHGSAADLQKLNIHAVIFEHVFKDAYNMETVEVTEAVWQCLCLCLDHFTEMNSFEWNQSDDMLERLIHNVTVAPNAQISIVLLQYITRISFHFTINRSEVEEKLTSDLEQREKLEACREICSALNTCISFRWAKSILQMLLLASDKLMQSTEICKQLLYEMHCCFLVCIYPIPLQVLHVHLQEFLTKFVAVLLECLVHHERQADIVMLVQQFTETFSIQLVNSKSTIDRKSSLDEFIPALKSLQEIIAK